MITEIHGLENLAEAVYNIFDNDMDKIEGLWIFAYRF